MTSSSLLSEIFTSSTLSVLKTENSYLIAIEKEANNNDKNNHNDSPKQHLPQQSMFSSSSIRQNLSTNLHGADNEDNSTEITGTTTTAFFRDSTSGRSKILLPVLLQTNSIDARNALLDSGAVIPPPWENSYYCDDDDENDVDHNGDENDEGKEEDDGLWSSELATLGRKEEEEEERKTEISFECRLCMDEYVENKKSDGENVVVEGVVVLSTSLVGSGDGCGGKDDDEHGVGIRFDVEVTVRSLPPSLSFPSSISTSCKADGTTKFKLEIQSILKLTHFRSKEERMHNFQHILQGWPSEDDEQTFDDSILAMQTLDIGTGTFPQRGRQLEHRRQSNDDDDFDNYAQQLGSSSYFSETLTYILPPPHRSSSTTKKQSQKFESSSSSSSLASPKTSLMLPPDIVVNIVPALTLNVREVSGDGASSFKGVTLVSLVISHSNLHNEDVTITSVNLHPGHSRPLIKQRRQQYSNNNIMTLPDFSGNNDGATSLRSSPIWTAMTEQAIEGGRAMPGGEHSVVNMSRHVRWEYAPGTAPNLPLCLKPNEAIATVIKIYADMSSGTEEEEDFIENLFIDNHSWVSPVCVRAMVGQGGGFGIGRRRASSAVGADVVRDAHGRSTSMVMVSTDAVWTTARVVLSPSSEASGLVDAFRVDLSIQGESYCKVGDLVKLSLRFMNLSNATRDLMLMMAKEEEEEDYVHEKKNRWQLSRKPPELRPSSRQKHVSSTIISAPVNAVPILNDNSSKVVTQTSQQQLSSLPAGPPRSTINRKTDIVNTPIVSEVNGYTFGVFGLSGEDDGTVRYSRDHELLAVDTALLLGEVRGKNSIEAELRFIPLKVGTLDVPNLKLYDKCTDQWYDCVHPLQIVSLDASEEESKP